ncbi:MAG: zeta toxin family protein [Polyangiales bacterium]
MSDPDTPVLHLIVGVNGAGKTTFYYRQLKPYLERRFAELPFVNADEIQRTPGLTADPQDAYQAARMAAERRAELLEQRRSFVAETVFSHPSKIDLIREAQARGFRVFLYHLHVRTPELAVKRVETRVLQGGHDVPPHKVAERFPRTLLHVREAVGLVDRCYVYDNSLLGGRQSLVMSIRKGQQPLTYGPLPVWATDLYEHQLRDPRGKD